jgi:hypothetical protein
MPETKYISTGNIRLCYNHLRPYYAIKRAIKIARIDRKEEHLTQNVHYSGAKHEVN